MRRNPAQQLANAIEHSTMRVFDAINRIPRRTKVMLPSGMICTTMYEYYVSHPQQTSRHWLRSSNGTTITTSSFAIL